MPHASRRSAFGATGEGRLPAGDALALRITEFFGFQPADMSERAVAARASRFCPFLDRPCTKTFADGEKAGACAVTPVTSGEVVCCANRLYAENYRILQDVADVAFGGGARLIRPEHLAQAENRDVAVFGKRWGRELRIPQRRGAGSYFVDWILVLLRQGGDPAEFVAVEVQSIDTTGNYRAERDAYLEGRPVTASDAGLNWENVSKRILPQLIYKGHVLRRERLCLKGLFFVSPTRVYDRIRQRLARNLDPLHMQPGSLTFMWYDLGPAAPPGQLRALTLRGHHTTTVDQVALAFTAPQDLPEAGVYEGAIRTALRS